MTTPESALATVKENAKKRNGKLKLSGAEEEILAGEGKGILCQTKNGPFYKYGGHQKNCVWIPPDIHDEIVKLSKEFGVFEHIVVSRYVKVAINGGDIREELRDYKKNDLQKYRKSNGG